MVPRAEMKDSERIYSPDSLERRLLRGDPEALGEVIR